MKRSNLFPVLIGAVIVVLIVTAATLWMSAGARKATDDAVEKVSEFYLEELADRRSQVVTRFFETKADQMQRALALMTQEDLSSQEAFRSFIGRVEALYGLELFAVVDEDNVVYTEHTTYMGGSRYAFLSDELSRIRTITTNATYGGGKDICLSLPVQNRVFNGKKLKTCFIEINMDDIVSMLAFNTQEKGTYFSLYYENGENLTGLDFGPVGAKQNLLTFMSRYLTAAEAETLSGNFRNGTAGKVLFSFSGAGQMFYYSPIPETGWMITVLIPENLIYDQIGGIREETMNRSIIQISITCAALLAFFGVLALKAQRGSRALLEEERKIAERDSLTGVGNKYAYTQKGKEVDDDIRSGHILPFALVVCDLNGLKQVNDTQGHAAGDNYIREASQLICDLYKHSPVYRIGGDEFVVFLEGADYGQRSELLESLNSRMAENAKTGGVVIAAGMAEYQPRDSQLFDVFSRADSRMYERKKQLKNA